MTADEEPFVPTERVEMRGHLIDSGQLARALEIVVERGADYEVEHFDLGKRHDDASTVHLTIAAPSSGVLEDVLASISDYGAVPLEQSDANLVDADRDGCFPNGFYSTTNLPTQVRVEGAWIDVAAPEMDCGVVVSGDGRDAAARTVPMLEVRRGDRVVVGFEGVRVRPQRSVPSPSQPRSGGAFGFMTSDVSSEKPQHLLVQRVAVGMREARAAGRDVLWVAGPALVHTGSVPATVALIRAGYVQALFAGNALPTHDIEAAMYGTSLGVSQASGVPTEHGHSHHIRAVNAVRRAGSIALAARSGVVTRGIMHACVTNGVDTVLAGSVRDDGPLPDVVTDMVRAQTMMRQRIWLDRTDEPAVGFCLVVATMLHGIATGNLLPASVPLVCVDINPATVTKLADRGSAQALGVVTDVGLFVKELAEQLAPDELVEELARADADAQRQAEAYRAEGRPA